MRLTTIKIDEDTHGNNGKPQTTLGTNTCSNSGTAQVATNGNACSGNSGAQGHKINLVLQHL